jgi:AcrR family transcriptional regulator
VAAEARRPDALPLAGQRPERADAARNRERIIEAARKLIARKGVREITLDDVAKEAGLGRATLYRRFPDRSALMLALLDDHERELQDRIIEGDPPLGPGASPGRRLMAFAEALLDLTLEHLELLLGSETTAPLARLHTGAYAVWHLHLAGLLRELRPEADADVLADLILALYDAELQRFLADEREVSSVRTLLLDSVRRLAGIRRSASD